MSRLAFTRWRERCRWRSPSPRRPRRRRRSTTPARPTPRSRSARPMPYSGPASAYGTIGKVEAAYFKKINDEGGINGRKINFISLDDGYSPPKTVEMVRRLVEQDEVLLVFQTLGTPIEHGDPEVPEREEGAAAVRRHRRDEVERPEELPVDDGLAAQLPDRGDDLRQAHPARTSRTRRSACSTRTTTTARTT